MKLIITGARLTVRRCSIASDELWVISSSSKTINEVSFDEGLLDKYTYKGFADVSFIFISSKVRVQWYEAVEFS